MLSSTSNAWHRGVNEEAWQSYCICFVEYMPLTIYDEIDARVVQTVKLRYFNLIFYVKVILLLCSTDGNFSYSVQPRIINYIV